MSEGSPLAELLYHAGLRLSVDPTNPDYRPKPLPPIFDGATPDPLHIIRSPVQPGSAAVENAQTSGLKLTLIRTEDTQDDNPIPGDKKDDCYVGAVVTGLPTDLRFFKVQVSFEAPTWDSSASTYGWAAAVFARKGDPSFYPTRNDRTTITLASSRNDAGVVAAKLNVPGGAPLDTPLPFPQNGGVDPSPLPDLARTAIYESGNRGHFTLELIVDRQRKNARAALQSRLFAWFTCRKKRWFHHPLIMDQANRIESIGFALGIASGIGTATIEVHDFRIYRLTSFEIFLIRLGALFGGIFSR